MTGETSIGRHGNNTWGSSLEFKDVVFGESDEDFVPVKEKRNSVKGRRELYRKGKSLPGGKGIPATERDFVAWDGEGYNAEDGKHYYVLFGNSNGEYVSGEDLGTYECLELIIEKGEKNKIHFGFAFGYDVNMILKDLSRNHLKILKNKNAVKWKRWTISYVPRKWFMVTDRQKKKTIKIWDIWSFFMCSFVKACGQYGVELSTVVTKGKDDRGTVGFDRLESHLIPYWKEENQKAVELVGKLRDALYKAELYVTQWHGPGAIASYSMQAHDMGRFKGDRPKDVLLASQYGYGGGRFELFKVGRANQRVYEYDINSAYPYAISQLPDLNTGEWRHVTTPTKIARFGIYRISWKVNPYSPTTNLTRPMPFFHRDARGQISFPCVNETWVWSPELWATKKFPGLTIHEGWEFEEGSEERPFYWIAQNYEIRKKLKREGNPAQLALKLQMNSMYGKMAQRVGWNEEKGTAPKWHNLEWAGWVVSYCRAMVFRAGLLCGNDLVAFETDAVFSTKPIREKLDIGSELGKWEETVYDDFIYLQSGCRFGLNPRVDGKMQQRGWQEKYRGFDKGSLNVRKATRALKRNPENWKITGTTTRFIGFGQALHTDFATWRTFQSGAERTLSVGGEGKRRHVPSHCPTCLAGYDGTQAFHPCILTNPIGLESGKHPLPWADQELLETQTAADEEKWEVE